MNTVDILLRIMESLDVGPARDTEAAWAAEVRVEALQAGTASTRPVAYGGQNTHRDAQ
jgi:hypothetical protein